MSNPSALFAVEMEAETNFGEDVVTFAGLRWPLLGPIDLSGMQQAKIDTERTEQYRNAGSQWMLGGFDGTFDTEGFLCGHGSSTAGATALTAYETVLGHIFGNADVSAAAGSTFTGGTAAAPTTTASGTFAPGSLGFGGVLGDGRMNGQAFAVSTHALTTLNLLTAAPAAPNAADVLYSGVNIYPSESPTSNSVQSYRMRLLGPNLRYELHGVVPVAARLSGFNANEYPKVRVTWAPSWWRYTTATFPSTLATETTNPGLVAAGSFFLNTVGVATRSASNVIKYRDLAIDYALGIERVRGPGGVNAYQTVTEAKRTRDMIKWSWSEDAEAATTTPAAVARGTGTTPYHGLVTLSTAPGSRLAVYSPNLCIVNVSPMVAINNLNRMRTEAMAYTGPTTTNDRTLSAFRMCFA